MLSDTLSVFSYDYFSRPAYPVNVLFNIVVINGFPKINEDYLDYLVLFESERGHRGITDQVWLRFIMVIDLDEARNVVNKVKDATALAVRRPLPPLHGLQEHILKHRPMLLLLRRFKNQYIQQLDLNGGLLLLSTIVLKN